MKEIKVKYFTDAIDPLCYVGGRSDWIDLHAAEEVTLRAGEFRLIPLGVAMARTCRSLPPGMSPFPKMPASASSASWKTSPPSVSPRWNGWKARTGAALAPPANDTRRNIAHA